MRNYDKTNSSLRLPRSTFPDPKINATVLEYIDVQKHMKPSIYGSEIQQRLLLDGLSVHPTDLPLVGTLLSIRVCLTSQFFFYKFHNGLVNCKLPDSVTRCSSRSLTRSHHLAYQRPQSNILTHYYSFFPRTLRVWNSLPCEVATSPSLDSFRHTALPATRSLKVPSRLRRL